MKNLLIIGTVAFGGGFLSPLANAYETAITDTSGYVVQLAKDGYNENSIISGAHFPGGAPVAGKHYLSITASTPVRRQQPTHPTRSRVIHLLSTVARTSC